MKILITGAFGNVGMSTVTERMNSEHTSRIVDRLTRKNKRLADGLVFRLPKNRRNQLEIQLGNLLHISDVFDAVKGVDRVIHLAAVIPPEADQNPEAAELVNVEGTRMLIRAMEKSGRNPHLLFASSVALYGDRLNSPYIKPSDPPHPNPDDVYARHKVACEQLLRNSTLPWSIFRLSYIADSGRLKLDPLMFEMPLATSLEICDTKDAGLAFAKGVQSEEIWGKVLLIAGGETCRIEYRDYLKEMFSIMGLGREEIPEAAFCSCNFHCGFLDTRLSQKLLQYQKHTLADFFAEVKKKYAWRRRFIYPVINLVRKLLFLRSSRYVLFLQTKIGQDLSRSALYVKYLFSRGSLSPS